MNPLHDPEYRRQDIDVGPLLLAELEGAKGSPPDCVDRTDIEALLHAEPRAPWLEHAESCVPLTIAMRVRWGLHKKKHPGAQVPRGTTATGDAAPEVIDLDSDADAKTAPGAEDGGLDRI